jgi:formyl-CoA transferase
MSSSAPLAGTVVVDLTRALAGPHAAMMLGDLGARVIKVESAAGDDTRGWGPPFVEPEGQERQSTYFLSCNRNKESIVLDLKADDGRDTLTALIERADVLIENFRPGVLDRLGFGTARLAELNPRLVTLSISGFGHDGPEGGRAGYDQIAQGEAGLMSVTGSGPDDPQKVGVPIGDLLAGMYGAYGVLAALMERERTGKGKVVRTSLLARSWASTPSRGRGGPWRARFRGRSATTTRRSPPTACSPARTAPSRSRSAARGCGRSSARPSTSTPRRRAWPPTATASATATR